jgi:hypothetical protein
MNPIISRISAWAHRTMPRREDLEHSRWVGPLARRHELWRFTRRSVPRGVAVGLLVGIFALIPGVQIVGAALMCVPCRGNIPLAALMTFLSNPLTTWLILIGSAWTANRFGFHVDMETVRQMMAQGASLREWGYWFLSDAAPGVLFGLAVISIVAASVGYLVSLWLWTWWVRHKRKVALERLMAERTQV